ncbi:hypothetical protein BDFB_007688, partial [Asbolus verrucosus]
MSSKMVTDFKAVNNYLSKVDWKIVLSVPSVVENWCTFKDNLDNTIRLYGVLLKGRALKVIFVFTVNFPMNFRTPFVRSVLLIRKILRPVTTPRIKDVDGGVLDNDEAIANIFANTFSKSFIVEPNTEIPYLPERTVPARLKHIEFSEDDIREKINKLKRSKSPGPNNIKFAGGLWAPVLQRDVDLLEAVQRRATRLPFGRIRPSYEERLDLMKLPTLAERRKR